MISRARAAGRVSSRLARAYATKERVFKDVVIVGGGPAGLTLAAALKSTPATRDLGVMLVEGARLEPIRKWDPSEDRWENRVSSLTPRSVRFLEEIGAWDHADAGRVKPYDEMKVWDGVSGSRIDFDPFILGENSDIAYMVENVHLQRTLLRRIDELAADGPVEIKDGVRVSEMSRVVEAEAATPETAETSTPDMSGYPVLKLDDGSEVCARLLVGADGGNSRVRAFADVATRGWAYNRHGLVATVQLEWEDFRSVAWQRFLPTGPLAMLPLPNGFASLVWSTTPERAQFLKQLEPDAFCAMVDAGFRLATPDLDYLHSLPANTPAQTIVDEVAWRSEITPIHDEENLIPLHVAAVQDGSRASFPLNMRHADSYIADRVALVGDAAHTTHPLAGQGLNMGQSDVAHLTSALANACVRGLDVGSSLALEPYWKAAYLPNHVKLGVFDKLHKLYSTDFTPLVTLRSWGLSAVNSSDLLKRFLMHNASN